MRESGPFSAETEMARFAGRSAGEGLITAEIASHCQSGIAITLAVRDPDMGALPGVGLGCRFLPEGRIRVLVLRRANDRLLMALTQDSRIAATFSRPRNHRAIQIKGEDAVIGAANDADRRATADQARRFRDELIDVGYSPEISGAFCAFDARDLVAIEYTPRAVFSQTPGPAAGSELKP